MLIHLPIIPHQNSHGKSLLSRDWTTDSHNNKNIKDAEILGKKDSGGWWWWLGVKEMDNRWQEDLTKKYQRKRQKNNMSHKIFSFPPFVFFFHKNFHKNKYLKNRVWRYYVLKTQLNARNRIVSSVHETEQTWGSPTHPLSWEEWGSKVKREQTWQAGCVGDVATLATLACAH